MNFYYYFQLPKLTIIALSLATILSLSQCGSNSENPQKPSDNSNTDTSLTVSTPPLLTEDFAKYITEFSSRDFPQRYDAQWLQDFRREEGLKEISPKECEKYLYGREVLNSSQKMSDSGSTSYYYAHNISSTEQYIALVTISYTSSQARVFLSTYKRNGELQQSLLLWEDRAEEQDYAKIAVEDGELTVEVQQEEKARYLVEEGGAIRLI